MCIPLLRYPSNNPTHLITVLHKLNLLCSVFLIGTEQGRRTSISTCSYMHVHAYTYQQGDKWVLSFLAVGERS